MLHPSLGELRLLAVKEGTELKRGSQEIHLDIKVHALPLSFLLPGQVTWSLVILKNFSSCIFLFVLIRTPLLCLVLH
jgi:hypothetical protein